MRPTTTNNTISTPAPTASPSGRDAAPGAGGGPLSALLSRLTDATRTTSGYQARCPAHDDQNASLSISEGDDGRVLVHCHAGCTAAAVVSAVGLRMADLFPARPATKEATRKIVAKYDYRDEGGNLLCQVVRYAPKDFRQRRPDGKGGWLWTTMGVRKVLYRLPELLYGIEQQNWVFVVEGEKDANALYQNGLFGTCNVGGAGKWLPEYADVFRGHCVTVIADKDAPGREHAETVAASLRGIAMRVTVLELPDRGERRVKDTADWFDAGGTADELVRLATAAPDRLQPVETPQEPPAGAKVATNPAPAQEPAQPAATNALQPDFPLSDYGNAERLVRDHGENLRFCGQFGKWFVWDGVRWDEDRTGAVVRAAKDSVRRIHTEAERIKPSEGRDEYEIKALGALRERIFRHALKSEESNEIKAMIDLAGSERGIPVLHDALDRDPFLFCATNGVVDLRSGALRPHSRGDLITKLAPVAYDPEAKCPRWEQFLAEVFDGDMDLVSYFRRIVGYSLTADVREQVLFFWYGCGANGKSTAGNVLTRMIGDYAQRAPRSLILQDARGASDKIPADAARLKGARMVICSELDEGRALAEATVKDLTGGDRIVARFMRQDFFEFDPTHKLIMLGNHRPAIRGTDHGVWRRIHLIPFTVTFGPDRRDPALIDKLMAELPGILNWAIRGCMEWQRFGLTPPKVVLAAVKEYQQAEDLVGMFLDERCNLSTKAWTSSKAVYLAYREWAEAAGDKPFGNRTFTNRLRDRGLRPERNAAGDRGWAGIALRPTPPPNAPPKEPPKEPTQPPSPTQPTRRSQFPVNLYRSGSRGGYTENTLHSVGSVGNEGDDHDALEPEPGAEVDLSFP